MRQQFCLAAPRAKMFTNIWFGPRELLFKGRGNELVRLLAVPVRLQSLSSSSDTATSASALATTQNNCLAAEATSDDSLQEIREGKNLKRKAEVEVHVDCPRPQKLAKTKSGDAKDEVNTNHSVTFSDLPVELHRHIFTHIERVEDIICLGLTSRHFWSIAREYVREHYASFMGQWAGVNIVFVGDVEPGDYPPGLLSAEEVDELSKTTVDTMVYDEETDLTVQRTVPFTLSHFACDEVSRFQSTDYYSKLFIRWVEASMECDSRCKYKDPALNCSTKEVIRAKYEDYYPEDLQWILRNLTTKEFVRSEAIALEPEFIHGPNIDCLGFGEVVMSRTFWSTRAIKGLSDTVPIHRGVWAGHRFDITTLERHRDEATEAEWKDVSEEVASEIATIWESGLGPDWREYVCKLSKPLHMF